MRRLAGRLPSLGDAGIAAGFLAIMLVELTFDFGARGPRSGAVAMAVVMAVALAFRRRWPVSSYMVGTAALAAQALLFFIGTLYPYANLAHLYSVGAFATRRRAVAGLLIGFCGIAAYFSVTDFGFPPLPVVVAAIWFLAWAAGFGVARSREAAEAEQQEHARQSAAAERLRIAREIHDLVGHSINVMVVQAGAGRRILDSDAERARDALIAIEETGRAALGELDGVLGLLRADEPAALAPEPGLAALPALCDRLTAAGMGVEHRVEGDPAPGLPKGLDLSAFRIVQEALTNSLRHSGGQRAWVAVRYGHDCLELEVTDDGSPLADGGYRPGRGMIGIAERAAAFGGTAEHGPLPDRGFRVRARLPLS